MPSDSLIGFATRTLSAPASGPRSDSFIGFATATLSDPIVSTRRDSPIGFVQITMTKPHLPVRVFTSTSEFKRVRSRTYDGTTWR